MELAATSTALPERAGNESLQLVRALVDLDDQATDPL
jgi:hypothetical protein